MNKKSIFKVPFTIIILFLLSSCSYFTPQSSNEYTVTKKSPLVMPPDMNMAPPDGKKEINKSYSDIRLQESKFIEQVGFIGFSSYQNFSIGVNRSNGSPTIGRGCILDEILNPPHSGWLG